jgi:gluconolactonase
VITPEVVATDLGFAEGPTVLTDGMLAVVGVDLGLVYRVDPVSGAVTVLAGTGGGPNGAVAMVDGGVLVAQNGGFDFVAAGLLDAAPPAELTPTAVP